MVVDETFNILQTEGLESIGKRGGGRRRRELADSAGGARSGGTVVQLGILSRDAVSISLKGLGLREPTVFGSQRFETELDQAVDLLSEHPFLA